MNSDQFLTEEILSLALRQQIITCYTHLEKYIFLNYFKKIINTTPEIENKKLYFYLGIQKNYLEILFKEDAVAFSVKNKHNNKHDDNYFDNASLRTLLNLIRDGYSGIFNHSLVIEDKLGSESINVINTLDIINNVRNKIAHDSVNGFIKEAKRLGTYPLELICETVTNELDVFKEVNFPGPNQEKSNPIVYHSLNVLFHLLVVIKFLDDEGNY